MGFWGNMVSAVKGAVAKVATVVVYTVNSVISGVSEIFSSVVSGAMAALGVVDVDEDGDIDFDDTEELLEEKFKLLVGAFIFLFGSDSSESIWDKAKNMAKDFTIGTGYSLGNNMLFGIPTHVAGMNDNNLPDSISCKAGRIVGDVASIIRSGVEIAAGVGGEVGGLVLDASGVGAIAGVPINVGSAALAADGVTSGYSSFNNLAKDTMSFISSKGTGKNVTGKTKKYVPNTGKWTPTKNTKSEWLKENNYSTKWRNPAKDQLRNRQGNPVSMDLVDKNGNITGRIDKNYRVNGKVVPEHAHLDSDIENIRYWFDD